MSKREIIVGDKNRGNYLKDIKDRPKHLKQFLQFIERSTNKEGTEDILIDDIIQAWLDLCDDLLKK